MNSSLRLALDFMPLAAFFLAYKLLGLLPATAALIACTLVSLAIIYAKEKRIAVMPLVSGIVVTVFGTLTLVLQDEQFIKLKPTIINLIFAAILLGGCYFKKPMLKYLLADAMTITEEGWQKLSLRWGMFFCFLAGLNEFIWRNFSTDFWVSFKVFGMLTLTMVFTLSQIPLITRHWVEKKEEETNSPS